MMRWIFFSYLFLRFLQPVTIAMAMDFAELNKMTAKIPPKTA